MSARRRISASLLRGGTSKGVFLQRADLPSTREEQDRLFLHLIGSPDPNQLDGLGCADAATSKVMVVGRSERADVDVEYLFAQIAVDRPVVDLGGNCGNLTTAVGLYAVDEGMVPITEPVTTVVARNLNTDRLIRLHVPVRDGAPEVAGEHRIAGVPGTAPRIENEWLSPGGSVLGDLLPTGGAVDRVGSAAFGDVEVSIVDAASPIAFVRAADVGLSGTEEPAEVNRDPDLLRDLEELRGACAAAVGLATDAADALTTSPNLPKLSLLAPAPVGDDEVDLRCQMVVMGQMLRAYAVTGLVCTAAAVATPGTLPAQLAGSRDDRRSSAGTAPRSVVLSHPGGCSQLVVHSDEVDRTLTSVAIGRTARVLMRGTVEVP